MARKLYTGRDVDVAFDADVCIHAAECVRLLPGVFDTSRRPWVLPDGASAADVRATVMQCPSGALEVVEHAPPAPAPTPAIETATNATASVTIEVSATGPLRVRGRVRIVDAQGALLRETDKVSFCSCGHSATRPFCDGSHKTLSGGHAAKPSAGT